MQVDSSPEGGPSSRGPSGPLGRVGQRLALATGLGVLMVAILSGYGDVSKVLAGLQSYELGGLWVALLLSFANYLLRALRFHFYLKMVGVIVPLKDSVLVSLAGLVMTLTPGKVGEIVKSFLLKWTHGVAVSRSSSTVVVERLSDLQGLLLLCAWGLLAFPGGQFLALLCVIAAVAVALLAMFRPLGLRVLRLLSRLPPVRGRLSEWEEAYDSLLTNLRLGPVLVGLLFSVTAWFLQVVGVKLIAEGIPGAELSLQSAALIYSAPMLAGVLLLLPGGLGVTEFGMTSLLRTAGGDWATPSASALLTILIRLSTLWFAVFVGAVAFFSHRQLTRWAREEDSR